MRAQMLFFAECLRSWKSTGAVAPSGKALAKALCYGICNKKKKKILEVGPGTGAVTQHLIDDAAPGSEVDLAEINPKFVDYLENRFEQANQKLSFRVLLGDVREMDLKPDYDHIVVGIPFNNLPVSETEAILYRLISLLKSGGTLSFFEYMGIRNLRSTIGAANDRKRLKDLGKVFLRIEQDFGGQRIRVFRNFLPSVVYRVEKIS